MKDFETLYNEEVVNNQELKDAHKALLERKEKAIKKIGLICIAIFLISLPFFMFFYAIIIDLVIVLVSMSKYRKSKENKNYQYIFKQKIIKSFIENFFNQVLFTPENGISSTSYNEIEEEAYNRYYSDDYIKALVNNKNCIEMSNILTQYVTTTTDSDGHTHTTTREVFSGIAVRINLNKQVQNNFKITSNWGQLFSRNKLKMDSSEFEKYFDVTSENKVAGLQILTSDVMVRLLEFVKETKLNYYKVIMKDKYLYFKLGFGELFETGNISKKFVSKEMMREYYNDLKYIYELSDIFINQVDNSIL